MGKPRHNKKVTQLFSNPEDFFDHGHPPHQKQTPSGRKFRKNLTPQSVNQALLAESIDEKTLSIAIGKPGSGKTYISTTKGLEALQSEAFERLVLITPAIEAGEKLGYLPGDARDKVDPHYQPFYDALLEKMSAKTMNKMIEDKRIEIAPIAYLRGRTFNNAFIVCDEAQNCTFTQLKTIYSRLGLGSKIVFAGDPKQVDIPDSGFREFANRLKGKHSDIGVVELLASDIVRHPLLKETLELLED